MFLAHANDILTPGYLPFETGYRRLDAVQMEVASLHRLHGVSGRMMEWWMRQIGSDDWAVRQHPYGTRFICWIDQPVVNEYIGACFEVESIVAKGRKWRIRYMDPASIVDTSRFVECNISFAACARIGSTEAPHWVGKFVQVCRDTAFGCELRHRYWLGDTGRQGEGPNQEILALVTDDDFAAAIIRYDLDGMEHLASFLPALYAARPRS